MTRLPARWRCLLEAVPFAGAEQMARDAGLRDLATSLDVPLLRLYTWQPACVSFGAHEAAARRFSLTRSRRLASMWCGGRPAVAPSSIAST